MWRRYEEDDPDEIQAVLQGIEIVHECAHHCVCSCHYISLSLKHSTTCCTPCPHGHSAVRHGSLAAHLRECHGIAEHQQ